MTKVFKGKITIPGNQIETYLKVVVMEEIEKTSNQLENSLKKPTKNKDKRGYRHKAGVPHRSKTTCYSL